VLKLIFRSVIGLLVASGFAASAQAQSLSAILHKTPSSAHGAELFRNCIACHGSNGLGTPDGSVPVIAGQHASVIAKQLIDYRHAKRWDIRMEGVANRHALQSAQDVADVAAYAAELSRDSRRSSGEGEYLENGSAKYAKSCAKCHGPAGEGNAKTVTPKLAGQHYDYLLRQMYDAVDARRPNLSRSHVQLLKGFVMEDYEGVADYLSRLQ
jgi:cytochrome c553